MGKITVKETASESENMSKATVKSEKAVRSSVKSGRRSSVPKDQKAVSSVEAEVISEEADVFDDSRSAKNAAVVIVKPVRRRIAPKGGVKLMSDVVVDTTLRPSTRVVNDMVGTQNKNINNNTKTESEFEEDAPKERSHWKATLIAVAVALLVGLLGGLAVWLLGQDHSALCKIQFDSSGGSNISGQEIVCGGTIERPADPVKEGFEFQDWLYDGMPFDFGTQSVDTDVILVAKWLVSDGTEVVTVKFDTDGGSFVVDHEIAKGKTTSAPPDPTKDGYRFLGWYLGEDEFNFAEEINEDITLVAKWELEGSNNQAQAGASPDKEENSNKTITKISVVSARTVLVGESFDLSVTIEPKSANFSLRATSMSPSVVTCDAEDPTKSTKILCTGVAPGKAKVDIRDVNSSRTATIEITVEKVSVVGVSLRRELTMNENEVQPLVATVTPENATDNGIVWSSSNEDVVVVDDSGMVTAKSAGVAVITATTKDGGKSATCTVTVNAVGGNEIPDGGGDENGNQSIGTPE